MVEMVAPVFLQLLPAALSSVLVAGVVVITPQTTEVPAVLVEAGMRALLEWPVRLVL